MINTEEKEMFLEDIKKLRRNLFNYSQFIEETLEKIGEEDKYWVNDIDNTIQTLSEDITNLISNLQ